LAALWHRQGRQLLLAAAVFFTTYPSNIGTRFLIPAAVFLALAMGIALSRWKALAVVVVCAHAFLSWPRFMPLYCDGLRVTRVPVRAALRIEPEEAYLNYWEADYKMARLIEQKVPPRATVFGLLSPPMSYCAREVLGTYDCAQCNNLFDMVNMVVDGGTQPTGRRAFRFAPQELGALRVLQTGTGSPDGWSVNELRVLAGSAELSRAPGWRVTARPNPWEAAMAFDANPVTRWKSWQPLDGHEVLEVDFDAPQRVDAVVLDAAPNQADVRLRLEGRDAAGHWLALAEEPREIEIPPPPAIRRSITREMLHQGVGYMVVPDSSPLAPDLHSKAAEWAVTSLGWSRDVTLYRIE
jgi:hypothetical protein